jgi:hypothetical protein
VAVAAGQVKPAAEAVPLAGPGHVHAVQTGAR